MSGLCTCQSVTCLRQGPGAEYANGQHLWRGSWLACRHVRGTGQIPWQVGGRALFSAPQGMLKATWPHAQATGTVSGQGRQLPAA